MLALLFTHALLGSQVQSAKPPIAMLWSPYEGTGDLWDKAGRYSVALIGLDETGLKWKSTPYPAEAELLNPATTANARAKVNQFCEAHPKTQLLIETYFFEANKGDYPENSPWWKRDEKGNRVTFWPGCFDMRTDNPAYISHIVRRIEAVHQATGGKAGVYLDNLRFEPEAKRGWKKLLATLRKDTKNLFIMANAGWDSTDLEWVAPYLNGIMYEDSVDHTSDGNQEQFYARVAKYDAMMRKPTRSVVEVFGARGDKATAYRELARTLVYTDASFLFSDNTDGHQHQWRPEWNAALGRASQPHCSPDGKPKTRKFGNGFVAWNPTKGLQKFELGADCVDVVTGQAGTSVTLGSHQGAVLIRK